MNNANSNPVYLIIPAACSIYRSPRVIIQTVYPDRRVELSAPMSPSRAKEAVKALRAG